MCVKTNNSEGLGCLNSQHLKKWNKFEAVLFLKTMQPSSHKH